ncbi:MAG: Rrf2 family transcriptional regulator [Clostridia bacterium]|nr:Rrf2 family transcriptional regulator [Clostridia bacterium]
MMISTKGRYALRVMIDLATYSGGEYITLKEISGREDISVKYLEQVISLLNRAGFLQSLRGNNGGYRLAKPATQITAGDILRAAEGTLAPIACLKDNTDTCERRSICSTIDFWEGYYKAINDYVDNITLAELVEHNQELAGNDYVI